MSTRISFGNANAGAQAGIVNGDFRPEIHHHFPTERVETPPSPSIVIPFSRDVDFVDREAAVDSGTILYHIDRKRRRPGSRTALVGLGGVGKSQLAIEHAYRIRARSPDTWVFWIHASNAARFEQSVRDIAGCAKIYGWQDPKSDILQLVHDWLHNQANGPWVVVLDNADDADVLTSSSAARKPRHAEAEIGSSGPLLSYIPHCQHGSMLVTSRNRSAALEIVEDADIITVEPMNITDAVTLFQRKLSLPEADDEAEASTSLVVALEQMPLAIVQAAAYISHRWPRYSVQQYLEDYQASDRERAGLLSYEGGKLRRDRKAKNSILITWQISFDYIQKSRSSAADMLSLMSFCDRQSIPEILLRHLESSGRQTSRKAEVNNAEEAEDEDENDMINWSDDSSTEAHSSPGEVYKFEDDVLALRNYAFIRVSEDGQSFEMHRLVQLATLEWLQLHGQKQHWRHRFLTILGKAMPTGECENWATCRALFPHAQVAAAERPKRRDSVAEWARIMHMTAWYCREVGNITEAERLSILALRARKRILQADDEEVLCAIGMVASVYDLNGRWKDAEALQLQMIASYTMKLGDDHPETLTSMGNLAASYQRQGRWKEAELMELQVMENRKKKLGVDHLDTLTSMGNLALTYHWQGWWEEAEALGLQVIAGRKTKLGDNHPDTLTSMGNLAITYQRQARWEEAEALELQVMTGRKTKLGDNHPETMMSMGNLATIYQGQGRWKEAEALGLQVMTGFKALLGDGHPDTLTSMANLASTYSKQDRWQDAEELEVQVLETLKMKLGEDHPNTLLSMANLAVTYSHQGRLQDAEKLEVQVLENRKTKLGADHPDTLTSMGNLALTYQRQARWEEAEALELQVMTGRKTKLGDKHPETMMSMGNLATIYQGQGRWKEAEALRLKVMTGFKAMLGDGHPDTLTGMANLASTYRKQGRWKDAEELEVQVMETSRTKLGADHPSTLLSMANLARTYWSQDRPLEAVNLLRPCVRAQKEKLGSGHPDYQDNEATLARWESELRSVQTGDSIVESS